MATATCIRCGHSALVHGNMPDTACTDCECPAFVIPMGTFRWECMRPMQKDVTCGATLLSIEEPGPCARGHVSHWRRLETVAVSRTKSSEVALATLSASVARDIAHDASQVIQATLSAPEVAPARVVTRERLPGERSSATRVFRLGYMHKDGTPDTMHLYFTSGEYADGRLGEVFIKADKTGTLASGALDSLATMVSLMLQYGVPLEVVTGKLRHTRYPPAGFTKDSEFPSCTSIGDLLAQWLDKKYGKEQS